MKGLLIKDFKYLNRQNRSLIVMVIALLGLAGIKGGDMSVFVLMYITFLGALVGIGSVRSDEIDNGNAFILSLPITRKEYVLEKYILCFITGGGFCLVSIVALTVVNITKNTFVAEDILTRASMALYTAVLLISFYLPVLFKFGSEKSMIAVFGLCAVVAVIGTGIAKIGLQFNFDLVGFIDNLRTVNTGIVTATAFVIAVFVLALSCSISIGILNKKEF